jgi:hypothetical protein
VHRPDDAIEILACYRGAHGKVIPNSLKKGLGRALARFDEYQLAKYRKDRAELSLVDVVNLVHPPATEALGKLVKGTLAPAETWETKLTQAGAAAENDDDLAERKRDAWSELIRTRKIGYFALLRNLRNVVESAPEAVDAALAMLRDEKLIRKSLVLPFRFQTALDAVQASALPRAADALAALQDDVAGGRVGLGEAVGGADSGDAGTDDDDVIGAGVALGGAGVKILRIDGHRGPSLHCVRWYRHHTNHRPVGRARVVRDYRAVTGS